MKLSVIMPVYNEIGTITEILRRVRAVQLKVPVGYGPDDVEQLVAGTLPQHRVTKLSPRPASADDLRQLFLDSMTCW